MAITAGSNLNSVPAHAKQTLSSNYLDLASESGKGWAQQYVPDLMEKEAEVFGPRTISGFLSQVGAEEAMTADQVVWSEQSRLHLSYTGTVVLAGDTNGTFAVTKDIDGDTTVGSTSSRTHGIRVNDMVLLASAGKVSKCLVVETPDSNVVSLESYGEAVLTSHAVTASGATLLVIGSEFGKGASYADETGTYKSESRGANEPSFKSFHNKPIILKDYYEVSGSDTARIGWVEIASEEGQAGYMLYLKAEADTRARFNDY